MAFGEEREKFFKEYDEKTYEIYENFKIPDGIINFLYAPDCGGSISPEACAQIYEAIKDYDDNIMHGYIGRPDCAMFKDFKEIIKDCIESHCEMEWF